MAIMDVVVGEAFRLAERSLDARAPQNSQSPTIPSGPSSTSPAPQATTSQAQGGGGGPTSSPLLFFVALGFGVVFTNLWIIVGVKYCFRYNARNRALRNGEDIDQINMDNIAPRPHRRRREKKLMTMDEVNERFPLTKYKNWVATRASEGLPTAGGVTAPPSRAGSVRDVDTGMPSSPVDTKHSINTRPATAASDVDVTPPAAMEAKRDSESQKDDGKVLEKDKSVATAEDKKQAEAEQATAGAVNKQTTVTSVDDDDDDDDDHIHTAVPPELRANPGDSCAICIDTLEDDDDIRGLTCGHAFHAGCLDPWLTSRRACCPLCKADYYTPKPRPEGEAAEADRTRRRDARMNVPQPPQSAWTGIRGHPRLLLPTRFGSAPLYEHGFDGQGRRAGRRSRRQAAADAQSTQGQASEQAPSTTGAAADAQEGPEAPAQSRWRPRNPFSGISLPRLPGRNRPAAGEAAAPSEPSPSQLEAGTAPAAR